MKQHYLAQTYQSGFLDPNPPRNYEPFVWVYFRATQQWKAKAPINFAWITDLYTVFHADGTRDDMIEKLLGDYEGGFATAMRSDPVHNPLSDDHRKSIAGFLALLLVRPPRFLTDFLPKLFSDERTLRALADNIPRFAEALKKTFRNPDPADVASWFSALSPNEQKLVNLRILLPAVEKNAEKLYDRSWTFLAIPAGDRLISSDTPVSFTNLSGRPTALTLQQIDDPNVEIAFPMSADLALVIHNHGRKRTASSAPAVPGAAADLNSRVLWQSRDFIFTSAKRFPGDDELATWAARSPLPEVDRVHALLARLAK